MSDTLKSRGTDTKPPMIRKRGVFVHHGETRSVIDVVQFIRAAREVRIRRLTDVGD